MFRIFFLLLGFLLLFSSCASVDKYNRQISEMHSVSELHQDVEYAYELLNKYHPKLDWYIKKDSLHQKFVSLKSDIKEPLSTQEFYLKFVPVINSIRQGHTSTSPPFKKFSRLERKIRGKRTDPFKKIRFRNINDRIFVEKIFTKDSIVIGSEVMRVNERTTSEILDVCYDLVVSDGYNKTFYTEVSGLGFGTFYERQFGRNDSIQLTLKYRDSIYTYPLMANYANLTTDTSKVKKIKKKVSVNKKLAKEKRKARNEWEFIHGYDKFTKENTRSLSFIPIDSNRVAAYMKIRRFKNGNYKTFYENSFASIDSVKCEYMVIDLRDNFGGSLKQIGVLASYLTNEDPFVLVEPSEMNKRSSYLYHLTHTPKPWLNSLVFLTAPIHYPLIQVLKVDAKGDKLYFKYGSSKEKDAHNLNYKGKLYVIINGASFSASAIISTYLQATNRAVFVGEETGGAYNGTIAGMMPLVELPNSKVKLRFGMFNINTTYSQEPDGYGVKPDVYIPNISLEKDEQLEWILKDIKTIRE